MFGIPMKMGIILYVEWIAKILCEGGRGGNTNSSGTKDNCGFSKKPVEPTAKWQSMV